MKLPELNEFIVAWPKSLGVLQKLVLEYFTSQQIPSDDVWFPDIELVLPDRFRTKDTVQVVLFGGFLDRIFESGLWPDKNYQFWCMSPKIKKVMTEMLGFPENSIKVIPRYKLFPKSEEEKNYNLNSPLRLVYSGRLSSQKNIEMILAFTSILQEKSIVDVELFLLGEWDNHKPKSRGRFEFKSYQEHVKSFQETLQFTNPPVYINHLGHNDWTRELKENTLLVNFSTFYCEDFGVSIAQADNLGNPMLLSKWGAHCDVFGENILLVDARDIGESFSPAEQIILKAQIVVEKFLKAQLLKPAIDSTFEGHHIPLNQEDLYKIRSGAFKKYGHEIGLMGKNLISLYAGSESGKSFFKNYFKIFS